MMHLIYFTSDLHFDHANVIKLCQRPFTSVEEMNDTLIQNWNERVSPADEIYILGDFIFGAALRAKEFLAVLNGRKYFIRGNHDRFLGQQSFNSGLLAWVKDYHVLKMDGRMFVLFHYPIAEWDQAFRGAIHLYGHIHNSPLSQRRVERITQSDGSGEYANFGCAINVGVDHHNYSPVSIEEILAIADARPKGL